jgi:stage IV sporulation protein FB
MQFSLGRIPVRIQPLFILIAILIGWLSTQSVLLAGVWAVIIFFSVLVHELGHALTALYFGQSAVIELFGMGGATYRQGPPLKKWQDFLIVLNGPMAGFLLSGVAYLLASFLSGAPLNLLLYALIVAFRVNLFWTVVNLLPVHPLDGGHLLRIFLEGIMGFRGTQAALLISSLAGLALSIFFFMVSFWIAGALFFMFTFESFRNFRSTLGLTGQDQNEELQALFRQAQTAMESGQDEAALQLLNELLAKAQKGVLFLAATELKAQLLARLGRLQQAYDCLHPLAGQLSGRSLELLHQLSYQLGHLKEAILLGNRCFQHDPHYETAVVNSLCHAALGEVEPAIGWLRASLDEGLPNLKDVMQKREFDLIRQHPAFQDLLKSSQV